ncbi:hypothetical protein [Sphingobacterium multivorum]|uniref:Uncharacterized protein n=1 Tax=Sphingobacterium multivorum TaxID=28454 RepID=A0A653YR51_SPHMU|nr:hypothetical protein [Sphingobacterium multivorum]VXC44323.1 conserved hypothetical protein [Sphingobacterium multivorum]
MEGKSLHERIEFRGILSDWLRIFLEKLRRELKLKNIGKTQALSNSIKGELLRNGGDISAVLAKFSMYGRFVDMGVGNGVKAYERKSNSADRTAAKRYGAIVSYSSRKPKKWINKRKMAEVYRLSEILAESVLSELTADKMLGVLDDIDFHM